jgi:hypothetical protein
MAVSEILYEFDGAKVNPQITQITQIRKQPQRKANAVFLLLSLLMQARFLFLNL